MARLPTPGGDNGSWGNILNDYLAQVHKSDGTLKDDIVTATNIADGTITNPLLADGTIAETKLAAAVQTKLNLGSSPDWSSVTNKPADITNITANLAAKLNATDLDTSAAAKIVDSSAVTHKIIDALTMADAYIDFTGRPNGTPPSVMDSGQTVTFTQTNYPSFASQIVNGKLTKGALPGSEPGTNFATYYQAQLNANVAAIGTTYTVDGSDGSTTSGIMCIAAWATVFQSGITPIPQSICHVNIDVFAGTWSWYVSDGGGSSHLKSVKAGSFTKPASDGTTVWETALYFDPEKGVGYIYLPGIDSVTGTRYATLTNAEIAAGLAVYGLPAVTFAQLISGCTVAMVEHFAPQGSVLTARLPSFIDMWASVQRPPKDRFLKLRSVANLHPGIATADWATATAQVKTVSTSATNIYTDTGNTIPATIVATAGANGRIDFTVTGLTLEIGGAISRTVTDSGITSGLKVLTSASAAFTSDDVGRQVVVIGAGTSGGTLVTSIQTVTNSTTVTLVGSAGTTVSNAETRIYPTEVIVYARMRNSAGTLTANPEVVARLRAGDRWTGNMTMRASGLIPYSNDTWTLQMSAFPFGTGTTLARFGGATTGQYPNIRIQAIPS